MLLVGGGGGSTQRQSPWEFKSRTRSWWTDSCRRCSKSSSKRTRDSLCTSSHRCERTRTSAATLAPSHTALNLLHTSGLSALRRQEVRTGARPGTARTGTSSFTENSTHTLLPTHLLPPSPFQPPEIPKHAGISAELPCAAHTRLFPAGEGRGACGQGGGAGEEERFW
jgi:hypothetical protein